jgi:hypothetical protein
LQVSKVLLSALRHALLKIEGAVLLCISFAWKQQNGGHQKTSLNQVPRTHHKN